MDEARRKLLKLGALTAASAALPLEAFGQHFGQPAAVSARATGNEYDALSYLTANDFKSALGTTFTVQSQAGSARVTLSEVQLPPTLSGTTSKGGSAAANPQIFALRFKNVSGGPLAQGTYVFKNSMIGSFAMFIVPSSSGTKPVYYTGHVNRSIQ